MAVDGCCCGGGDVGSLPFSLPDPLRIETTWDFFGPVECALPSDEVAERGLGEFSLSGVVGESIACCSLLTSKCASVTLIFGNAASDIVPHGP